MDNKLWEGHRMLLPRMREKILSNNREKISPPQLSEEALARIEEKIRFAGHFQKPLLITYYQKNRVEECLAFTFRLQPGILECAFDKGQKLRIKFTDIINVEIL